LWLFWGLFLLAFFLHNTAAFLLAIALLVMGASHLRPPSGKALTRTSLMVFILLVAACSLALVPSFLRFVAHWREKQVVSGYWGVTPFTFALKVGYHLTPSLAVAALLGMYQLLVKKRLQGIFLASYALVGPVALGIAAALHVNVSAKYVAFTLPAFCIAAAYFLTQLVTRGREKGIVWAGVLAITLLPSLETDLAYFTHGWGNRDRLREAVRYVHERAAEHDAIVPVYFFKDPAEARFYLRGIAGLQGIELDTTRIIVPAREEDLHSLPRAWLITIGKRLPPEQPDMYRWLASSAHVVAEFPAFRGAVDNSVRVYFHEPR
jgi:hypothetical protein